ncbi:MAG TPA: hypothetical protein PKK43_06915 [Spirochaetota bacterium]|nr:hypothetical protein [Spirochaetota bacterium]
MKRTAFILIALFISGAFLLAEEGMQKKSKDWDSYSKGPLLLQNNTWGKKSITDYEQSILYNEKTGVIGYEWRWPDKYVDEGNYVKAYPEVIYGKKPWSPDSTVASMPELVSSCDRKIDFKLTHESTGENNIAFDIWITKSKDSKPEDITGEIMIWIRNNGMHVPPKSDVSKTVTLGGRKYDFMTVGGGGGGSWRYICFQASPMMDEGVINLKEFLAFLVKEKFVDPKHYVAAIEFGNEVVSGKGRTLLQKYEIR